MCPGRRHNEEGWAWAEQQRSRRRHRLPNRREDQVSTGDRARIVAHGSAWSVALRFETDDVIDPGETRAILRAAVAHAPVYDVLQPRWPIDAW